MGNFVSYFFLLQALTFFHTDELEAEVIKAADAARAKGITGVPITVIDGKWAVSGGQSSDVFVQVCDRLLPYYSDVERIVRFSKS